ncbi:hypothetical protein GCM10010970_40250 [Silvimonas iriomotensis]|uniref:Uncharacterized protein n=1 Tax=Silvimonas iriomotensis TaxID=449662 RepID=A0ABQ2PFJ2_9NEIS|nr:hypothetical protein GCM10010970_40250 [Silvimonas iriomotensis]
MLKHPSAATPDFAAMLGAVKGRYVKSNCNCNCNPENQLQWQLQSLKTKATAISTALASHHLVIPAQAGIQCGAGAAPCSGKNRIA